MAIVSEVNLNRHNQNQTKNSPSREYTNPDDQPTTGIDSPGSQPTTVLFRTTPTQTTNQPQTSATTNNSPSHDYTSSDDQSTTNIDSPGSQQTIVLLRTTPTRMINQPATNTPISITTYQNNTRRPAGSPVAKPSY